MRSSLLQSLVASLVVCLVCSEVRAEPPQPVPDVNEYLEMFQKIAKADRSQWAPSMAGIKFSQSLLLSNQYFDALSSRFGSLVTEIEKSNRANQKHLGTLETLWSNPNIDNYMDFIRTSLKYRLGVSLLREKIRSAQEIAQTFTENAGFYDGFCADRASKLPPIQQVNSVPKFVSRDGKVYTHHRNIFEGKRYNTFSEDPKAESAALAALPAAVLVGIGIYALVKGISLTAAFSAAAMNGGIALVGTGPGAVVILVAIAVAVVVSTAVTYHENQKRKKAAKRRYKREMRQYNEAKDWYLANKVTHEEFREIGLKTCRAKRWKKEVDASRESLKENIAVLEPQLEFLAEADQTLRENDRKVRAIAGSYAESLVPIYSAQYLKSLRDGLISQEKENTAVRYFNEVIKPEVAGLSAFYAQNRKDCFALEEHLEEKRHQLRWHETLLLDSYQDTKNASSSFFQSQLPKAMDTAIGVFERRVKRCFAREGMEEGLGPIFSI